MRFGKRRSLDNETVEFNPFGRGCRNASQEGGKKRRGRGIGFGGMFGDEFGAGFGGRFGGFAEKLKGKLLSSEEMHLIVLNLMKENEIYGYEIIKAVETLTKGAYSPSPGMIYPLLSYITELNHATSDADGNRKRFKITDEGIAFLNDNQDALNDILEKIQIFSERYAEINSRLNEDETAEKAWGRGNSGKPDFETLAQFHEIRGQLRKAMFSKRSASTEEKQRVLEILRRAISEINGDK